MLNVQGLSPQKCPPMCLMSLGWHCQRSDGSALLPCPVPEKQNLPPAHPPTWVSAALGPGSLCTAGHGSPVTPRWGSLHAPRCALPVSV